MSVRVIGVEKTYRLGENYVPALKGINMELKKGEFVALMGPSGSGKTTLLNLIGVLDKPTKGKVFVNDIDLTHLKEKELTNLRRGTIGFIFQFYNLIPVLSAFENVELPMLLAGVPAKERTKRAKELLTMVGLADRINHRPDELSGGEQQRVAIVRSLANKPSIVLADEPTGDLDSKTGKEVVQALRDLSNREGATVIIVTHDPTISAMANRVFEMRDGLIMRERLNDVAEANGMHVNEANKTNNMNAVKEGNNPEAEKNGATMADIANSNKMSRKDNEGNRVPGKGTRKAIKALGERITKTRMLIIAVSCLLFYAAGVLTNLFSSPIFSSFFILSQQAAYEIAYVATAIAVASIIVILASVARKRISGV